MKQNGNTSENLIEKRRLSLKMRILFVVISILVISLVGEVFLQVHNWKKAIRSEVESSFSLAKRLVGSDIIKMHAADDEPQETIVGALQGLRHIRVFVKFNHKIISSMTDEENMFNEAGVPRWFIKLIYPYHDSLPKVIVSSNDYSSNIIIEADPRDEIIEVWEDFRTQLMIILFFSIFVSVFIYFGLQFGLRPLDDLLSGFEKLETGSFDVRLSEDVSAELSRINQKFNHMVSVLRRTSEDNSLLARKMVNLQEEERRAITRELHDEMAPHLFGIRVTTSKLQTLIHEGKVEKIADELYAIDRIVENLQNQMRKLLSRLRPMVLEDLTIEEAVHALIQKKEISELGIKWELDLKRFNVQLDDTITVTLYRIIQECVTNIVRHSAASEAKITVSTINYQSDEKSDNKQILNVTVEDNGVGLSSDSSHGFGLIGMRERVQALGGIFEATDSKLGGLKIMAEIPIT